MESVTKVPGRPETPDAELDQLLHPSRFYERPANVAADELLTVDERRAILSSWASDRCAVDSQSALRWPPLASEPVTFDEIMDALTRLDRQVSHTRTARQVQPRPAMVGRTLAKHWERPLIEAKGGA